MNDIISGDKVGWYFVEEIPGAEVDIERKPSLRGTLGQTDVEAIKTDSGWKLLCEVK